MTKTHKILSGKYDTEIAPTLIMSDIHITKGNDLWLQKSRNKYDLRKYYFTNRVLDHRNNLPNWVVTANNTNVFKTDLINIGSIKK